MRLHVITDALGQRSFIEIIARSHQRRMTPTAGIPLFGRRDRSQSAREIGLDKHVANFWHVAVGQEDALGVRPL